jgi:hypothetical protein
VSFFDHVSPARDAYVEVLRHVITELRRTEENVAVELLIQPNGAENPRPFCLFRPDVMVGKPPDGLRMVCVKPDTSAVAPGRYVLENGLEIELESFSWESCAVRVDRERFDLRKLGSWLTRWMDEPCTREPDAHGLCGVIHGIAWTSLPSGVEIVIDFGSAPIDALRALLELLHWNDVRNVRIRRNDADETTSS